MNKILLENGFEYMKVMEEEDSPSHDCTHGMWLNGEELIYWGSPKDFRDFDQFSALFQTRGERQPEYLDALSALKAYAISEGYLKP